MKSIRNIYCVGRNYRLHAEELGNAVPTSPFLFSKPTHALVEANGQEIELPGDRGEVHHELEVVVHIAQSYKPGVRLEDVIDQFALGIDFTLRDVQSELKKKGHPWLLAKGFPNSGVLTAFQPFSGLDSLKETDFSLLKNEERVQIGNVKDMLFDFQTIIEFSARHFGLNKGDIIYTGTPAGVGPVASGDHLSLLWGNDKLGDFTVKLV
jgi:fumarylpyruvate hydrolase